MRLFVDNLTNVDFSYLDARRGLVGETWLANIRLEGELDEQGMVCDFGTVKKVVRQWLDTELDHRLAVPTQAPNLTLLEDGEELAVHWQLDSGEQIQTRGPRQAFALVDAERIDIDSTARWVERQLEDAFPQEFEALVLDFATEAIDGPYYHYSHGLKKHAGNCQRIAHGHRSRIDIWADGEKNTRQESLWAERWRDIYIATREDITAEPSIEGVDYIDFAYRADQGAFYLRLPRENCYLIDTDSTVECLATHIAERTASENPGRQWRIRAYEGANKGAEAEASS